MLEATVIECRFCGAASSIAHDVQTVVRPATPSDQLELLAAKRRDAWPKFEAELVTLVAAGKHPYDAVRDAWALHLAFYAAAEPVAHMAIALARDFEREQGASATDAQPLSRLADAYLGAVAELRAVRSTESNLPYLTTQPEPKHLQRTVTPVTFAELARRDPYEPEEAPPTRKKLFGLF